MPYRLTVNGEPYAPGTFREVRALVAQLVTDRLEAHPEGLALDAQTVNMAFNSGAVQEALDQRGEWFTIFGLETERPLRIKVTKED